MRNRFSVVLYMASGLLVAMPASANWFSSCENASQEPRPEWVSKLDYSEPGFHVGVGSAEKNNKGAEEQVKASEANAKSRLVQQIEVTIRSESEQGMQVKNKDVQNFASSKVVVTAEEVLRGLKIKGRWVDRDGCIVHTLMVISKDSVAQAKREKLMKARLEKLKQLLADGSDREKNRLAKTRKQNLEDAKLVFSEIDFSLITEEYGKAAYSKKMDDAMAEVDKEMARTQGRIAMFALNRDGKIPHDVIGRMMDQLRASDGRTDRLMVDCASADECINKAKERGFDQLALIKVDSRVEVSNIGAHKGTLSVSKTVYDIVSKNVVNGPYSISAQVIGWGNEDLNWDLAAEKVVQGLK